MAWVTNFTNRYRFDLFFRTECNVIALQVVFIVLVLILIAFSFNYLYHDISKTLFNEISNNINTGKVITPGSLGSIISGVDYLMTKNLLAIIIIIISITVFFGYLVAQVTLIPAKNSLNAQKQFIGNIAHELRTPLSIIKTNIEVSLLKKSFDDDYIKKMLNSNVEELNRISDTINNLLSFNTLVRPENIKFENVDLSKTVDFVVGNLSDLIKSKYLILTLKKPPEAIIKGKAVALEQIVINLLTNAINYTPEGGSINLIIEEKYNQKSVELRIEDTGVGIAREDLFHIAEPFYRADPSRARNHSGSGLGLAIVNELVKLHNGKIFIKSVLKEGTTVTVSFPTTEDRII